MPQVQLKIQEPIFFFEFWLQKVVVDMQLSISGQLSLVVLMDVSRNVIVLRIESRKYKLIVTVGGQKGI